MGQRYVWRSNGGRLKSAASSKPAGCTFTAVVLAVAVSSKSGARSNAASDASVSRPGPWVCAGRRARTGDRPTASWSIWAAPAAVDGDPDRVDVVPSSSSPPTARASLAAASPPTHGDPCSFTASSFRRRRFGRRCSETVFSTAADFSQWDKQLHYTTVYVSSDGELNKAQTGTHSCHINAVTMRNKTHKQL